MKKLNKEFYLKNTHTIARELLGKTLVFGEARAIINETESYIGSTDKVCHAYGGRKTKRTEILYAEGGVFYIYLIYGMYCCLNVITERADYASGVLIRGAKLIKGREDIISRNRFGKNYDELSSYQKKNLLNGPGKVCMGLGIDRSQNGISCLSEDFYIAEGEKINPVDIKIGKRIGIDYAEEAKDFLWRYYL